MQFKLKLLAVSMLARLQANVQYQGKTFPFYVPGSSLVQLTEASALVNAVVLHCGRRRLNANTLITSDTSHIKHKVIDSW